MHERDARRVGHVARLVKHHFVTGIAERAQRQIECLAHAHRHDDLIIGSITDGKVLLYVGRDRATQFDHTEIRRVVGLAALERKNGGFPDVPGRDEVGLTHPERDDVLALHLGDKFEEIADTALRQRGDVASHPAFWVVASAHRGWARLGRDVET